MLKITLSFCFFVLFVFQLTSVCNAVPASKTAVRLQTPEAEKVSLIWQPISSAVEYEVKITNSLTRQTIDDIKPIFAAGLELDLTTLAEKPANLLWQVRGLDYYGKPLSEYSQPQPLLSSPVNSHKPTATTQYDKMPYSPLYPVYSWIPYLHAKKYDIRIYLTDHTASGMHDKLINEYHVDDTFDFYDTASYTQPGKYYWMVQARSAADIPISDWSVPSYFSVLTQNIKAAALGDSITHGGGAISTPPGYPIYNWETYSPVPILNIGCSGDTTKAMLDRFNKDVLPFHPTILVIMGGVNDIRSGINASDSINNLSAIRDLCVKNNIIPVMVTASPIYPDKFEEIVGSTPASDWQNQLKLLNAWILSFPYAVNTYKLLADEHGLLKSELTTDGLHPDAEGKKLIGEAIGNALLRNYPAVFNK